MTRTTKEEYQLTDEGAIVTEKIAKALKVGIGDTITLKDDEGGEAEVPVTAICENYLNHYIYLTPACYERAYKAAPEFNSIFTVQSTDSPKQKHSVNSCLPVMWF